MCFGLHPYRLLLGEREWRVREREMDKKRERERNCKRSSGREREREREIEIDAMRRLRRSNILEHTESNLLS